MSRVSAFSLRPAVLALLAFFGGCTSLEGLASSGHDAGSPGAGDAGSTDSAIGPVDGSQKDATSEGDAAPGTICRWDAPFTTVGVVLTSPDEDVAAPQLSPDEKVMYFQGTAGAPDDLDTVSRADRTQPFGDRQPISELNVPSAKDTNIAVRADGLVAVISSDRADAGAPELYASSRMNASAGFSMPVLITTLGPTAPKATSFITKDGSELWFSVTDGVTRATYLAPAKSTSFGQATPRTDVPGWFPVLSDDKLTIYFAAGQTSVDNAIRVSHRAGPLDAFPPSSLVNEVNQGGDTPSWLSPDQCRLYMTTQRNKRAEIFMAERRP